MSRYLVALVWPLFSVCAAHAEAPASQTPLAPVRGSDEMPLLHVRTPMPAPDWALLEREVLRASATACEEFFAKYFDERGFLLCVERWGGDDGPDDAIENCNDWPILHALGAKDKILRLYKKAWEGHLRQYTLAKTTHVPFAKDGMYYKEFPVMFDWLHHAEGLTVFCNQGLGDPGDPRLLQRARRYAGFYLNEEPGADNYDPKHKIIRSMFNGSRGPLLRKATALDWAGDPIEVNNRFAPRHGERSYDEMLAHFKDYNDIVGDHPQNLMATSLALNAFLLTGEKKYKDWILDYADAWRQRILDNGGILPTNVGLDGKIGGAAGGKWYGGVYGWAFTVVVPQTGKLAHRNNHVLGIHGFGNAFLLTGDDRFLDPWRQMIDKVNAHSKTANSVALYPHMHGDQGWYDFRPDKYKHGAEEIWYWSMRDSDLARVPPSGWIAYLQGKNSSFPEQALRQDLETIRRKVAHMRADKTTPDTRLADDPMGYNPAVAANLVRLTMGGLHHGNRTLTLHARLRYFDPDRRRAGLPDDVAALVEKMTAEETVVWLVNVSPVHGRRVVLQAGGYGEHEFTRASGDGVAVKISGRHLQVDLEPGAGTRLVLRMRRYVHPPRLRMPFN
ncbi:MAG: hypothetical protein L0Y70_02155 [Gemmataceae bacterium]|nr:hypothetical protein [Gemmataceae bacterium]